MAARWLLLVCAALAAPSNALVLTGAPRGAFAAHAQRTSLPVAQELPNDTATEAPEASAPPQKKEAGLFDPTTTVGTKTIPLPPAVLTVVVSVGFVAFVEGLKAVDRITPGGNL